MADAMKRILVAEDSMATAMVLRYALEKAGFHVTVVSCGESAWRQLSEEEFDVVVSDFQMPGMTGGELCERMGANPRLASTPLILLTARAMETELTYPLEVLSKLGAMPLRAILGKPFSPRELVAKVRECLAAKVS